MTDQKLDSQSCFEVTVHLKGEDQSYRKKYLCYEEATINQTDPIIREFIEDARKEVKFDVEEIRVKASF